MRREPIAYTVSEDDLGRPAYIPVFKEEKKGMKISDKGKVLYASEIDFTMGTAWPKVWFICLSSHAGLSVSKEFSTLDEFETFLNNVDMQQWIDDRVREHWPDSDYAKALGA